MAKDFYKILGIKKEATDKDIKKAYRKLSLKYHPDKQAGKSENEKKKAEEKMVEINEAYEVLSDKRHGDTGPQDCFERIIGSA